MSNIDPNNKMINGPVNIIRLQGDIDGIDKVIYLFLDFHMEVTTQTQCQDIFSKDVQKYFVDSFYHLSKGDRTYDFFLEIYPSELADLKPKRHSGIDYKDKYIEEVVKFFRKVFKYDSKKNKVMVNKLFKNVRLHYIDVRDYYKLTIHDQMSLMIELAHGFMCKDGIDLRELRHIVQFMEIMRDHFELIIDSLEEPTVSNNFKPRIIKHQSDRADVKTLKYLSNKIKTSYKHKNVEKIMNKLVNESIDNFSSSIDYINESIEVLSSYEDQIYGSENSLIRDDNSTTIFGYGLSSYTIRNMIVEIVNRVDKLFDDNFIGFFARLMDIYFLRRFLDKDYITNVIAYTGAMHSNTYIYMLVKYFGFKITDMSHHTMPIKQINNEIKERSLMETQELILPKQLIQCSNMSSFPENFL